MTWNLLVSGGFQRENHQRHPWESDHANLDTVGPKLEFFFSRLLFETQGRSRRPNI